MADMNKFRFITFCTIAVMLTYIACKPSPKKLDISGRWVVTKALRNEVATHSLDNAYFEFQGDGLFVSNIFGDEKPCKMTRNKDSIKSYCAESLLFYFKPLAEEKLELTFEYQNYAFKLFIVKV